MNIYQIVALKFAIKCIYFQSADPDPSHEYYLWILIIPFGYLSDRQRETYSERQRERHQEKKNKKERERGKVRETAGL